MCVHNFDVCDTIVAFVLCMVKLIGGHCNHNLNPSQET